MQPEIDLGVVKVDLVSKFKFYSLTTASFRSLFAEVKSHAHTIFFFFLHRDREIVSLFIYFALILLPPSL